MKKNFLKEVESLLLCNDINLSFIKSIQIWQFRPCRVKNISKFIRSMNFEYQPGKTIFPDIYFKGDGWWINVLPDGELEMHVFPYPPEEVADIAMRISPVIDPKGKCYVKVD